MVNELLTWFGVIAVVLLAWTLYISCPRDEDEQSSKGVKAGAGQDNNDPDWPESKPAAVHQ